MTKLENIEAVFAQWGMTLYEVADTFGYSEVNKAILLATDIDDLIQYRDLISKALSLEHNKDNRTTLEFLKEMVANWLIEDYIKQLLEYAGFTVNRDGSDCNREFQYNGEIRTNSDFILTKDGITRNVELQVSFTDYWNRVGEVFLRDNKFEHLYSRGDILLLVDFNNFTFTYYDLSGVDYQYRYSPKEEHPWLPKDGYQIYLGDHVFYNLNNLQFLQL